MHRWKIVICSVIAAMGLVNCSFTKGSPWGEVEGQAGAQSIESMDSLPSEVSLDRAAMNARLFLESVSTSSGESGGSFDPSNPPEGYTLCHNGHCHSDEGELVSYEDVRAELNASGGTSTTTLGSWQADIDLKSGEMVTLPAIGIGQRTSIDRIRVRATNVVLEGSIQTKDGSVPMEAQLGQFDVGVVDGIGLTVGPNSSFERTVRVCASWKNNWFEEVDFSQLERQEGTIRLTRILNGDATTNIVGAIQNATLKQSNCA